MPVKLKAVDGISPLSQTSAVTVKFTRASESPIMNLRKDPGCLRSEMSCPDGSVLSCRSLIIDWLFRSIIGLLCFLYAFERIAFEMRLSMCFPAFCTTTMIDVDYISPLSLTNPITIKELVYFHEARRFGCRRIFVRHQCNYTHLSLWRFVLHLYVAPICLSIYIYFETSIIRLRSMLPCVS